MDLSSNQCLKNSESIKEMYFFPYMYWNIHGVNEKFFFCFKAPELVAIRGYKLNSKEIYFSVRLCDVKIKIHPK